MNDMRDFEKESLITEDDLYQGQENLQELTDKYVKQIDQFASEKEKEIMEV